MTNLWFNVQYAWIPGTIVGFCGALVGTLAGVLTDRGKARGLVIGLCAASLIVCAGMLATAIAALVSGQPYPIWYALLLPGAIGVSLFGSSLIIIRRGYRIAEERRFSAKDLLS